MVFLIFWIENTAFNSLSQSQFHKRKQLASFQSRFTVYLAPHAVEPALPVSKRGAAATAPAAVQSQNVFVCHSPYMEHNETNVWCVIGNLLSRDWIILSALPPVQIYRRKHPSFVRLQSIWFPCKIKSISCYLCWLIHIFAYIHTYVFI